MNSLEVRVKPSLVAIGVPGGPWAKPGGRALAGEGDQAELREGRRDLGDQREGEDWAGMPRLSN